MKFFSVLAAFVVVVLGVANAHCPKYPKKVSCRVDPCLSNNCQDGQICCPDYSKGCNYHCLAFKCPNYPKNISCLARPCEVNPCPANKVCCDDFSTGCNSHCFPK